jgi:orotate phosphoribosyltransferase
LLDVILDSQVEAVGGLEIGSVPIADAIGIAAHLRGRQLPTFIVRKAAKKHGTRSQIAEAFVPDGPLLRPARHVAIVDDVITTGASIAQSIDVVKALGCEVDMVIALVERHESQRRSLRDLNIPILTVFYTDESGRLIIDEGFVQRVEQATSEGLVRR